MEITVKKDQTIRARDREELHRYLSRRRYTEIVREEGGSTVGRVDAVVVIVAVESEPRTGTH